MNLTDRCMGRGFAWPIHVDVPSAFSLKLNNMELNEIIRHLLEGAFIMVGSIALYRLLFGKRSKW